MQSFAPKIVTFGGIKNSYDALNNSYALKVLVFLFCDQLYTSYNDYFTSSSDITTFYLISHVIKSANRNKFFVQT